jgi:adenylate cyclase
MAFAKALEETSRRERESSTRPALLARVALAAAWSALAGSALAFDFWPEVAATAPVVGGYAAVAVLAAARLWRSGALLRSWVLLPALDVPVIGALAWRMVSVSAVPAAVAAMALGAYLALLIASQRSLSNVIVWWVAGTGALLECALLWRAGIPMAMPAAVLLLAGGAWPLQRGRTRLHSLRERLVQEHASLQRFGRFYTPLVAVRDLPPDTGASHDDCPVTLVYVELHHPGGDAEPYREAAEMEEAITAFDDAIAPMILRHGGTPDRSAGAGLMVYFLRHAVLGDDGARAVRFALEISAAAGPLNHRRERAGKVPLAVGIGIHASWAAVDRSEGSSELVALGNSVGIAAELAAKSWASKAPALVSPETRVRAASGFTWAQVGPDAYLVGLEPKAGEDGSGARLIG